MSDYKQVLLIRTDLKMRRGKEIAQGAHASMITLLDHKEDPRMKAWLEGKFVKIALSVPDEGELLKLYLTAKERNMICSLVTDAGLTEFHGIPTNTVVAIGPDKKEVIDEITGHLILR